MRCLAASLLLLNSAFGGGIETNGISVVRIQGEATLRPSVPANGEPAGAVCFDVPEVVRVEDDKVIGRASDCLNITVTNTECGSMRAEASTFFYLDDDDDDVLGVFGVVTAQPTVQGSSLDFTHTTGAVPQAGTNSVIYGRGDFVGTTGTSRLGGALRVSNGGRTIYFSCLFVLNLSTPDEDGDDNGSGSGSTGTTDDDADSPDYAMAGIEKADSQNLGLDSGSKAGEPQHVVFSVEPITLVNLWGALIVLLSGNAVLCWCMTSRRSLASVSEAE